ncbi:MAG: outer membrane beta-barrel protein [Thermodesulfobacteriota bacterium]|nr:outer membrane beta-barrel protein [Thermodesulfobacteriota bacterium]
MQWYLQKVFKQAISFSSFVLIITAISLPTTSMAREKLYIGRLEISPLLNLKGTYTDNVYQTSDEEESDLITTLSPFIGFALPVKRHVIKFDYMADIIKYSEYNEHDTEDHLLKGLIDLQFQDKWNVKFGNDWNSSSTPPEFETDERNDFYLNTSFAKVSYKFADRYTINTDYKHITKRFDKSYPKYSDRLDNFDRDDIGASIVYQAWAKTSILFEYIFTDIDNEDYDFPSTDSESHTAYIGLIWKATAKLTGVIKGGYIGRDYDDAGEDETDFAYYADLTYNWSKDTIFLFSGAREILETSVTAEEGPYGTNYISTSADISLEHRFTSKLSSSFGVSYTLNDFSEKGTIGKKRKDDRYTVTAGLTHKIIKDWLIGNLKYDLTNNESNIAIEDYKENQVTFNLLLIP